MKTAGRSIGLATAAAVTLAWDLPASAAWIWGRVLDARTGTPLAGARLTVSGSDTTALADGQGYFCLPAVTQVDVRHAGYDPQRFSFTGASVRLGNGGGTKPLAASGWMLRLKATPLPPEVLPTHLGLSWRPDGLSESNQGTDGVQVTGGGWRLGSGRLEGAVRWGPVMMTGAWDSLWYPAGRSDSGQDFDRWQNQGLLSVMAAHRWSSRLAVALGVAGLGQSLTAHGLSAPQGRPLDYLDVPTLRVAVGVLGLLSLVPVPTWPLTLETRLALLPAGWQLSDPSNMDARGLWALQASAGGRWFVTPSFALEARYRFEQWRSTGYYQGGHGLATGIVATW